MSSFFFFETQESVIRHEKLLKHALSFFCCSDSMQTVHYHVIMQLDSNSMLATG